MVNTVFYSTRSSVALGRDEMIRGSPIKIPAPLIKAYFPGSSTMLSTIKEPTNGAPIAKVLPKIVRSSFVFLRLQYWVPPWARIFIFTP